MDQTRNQGPQDQAQREAQQGEQGQKDWSQTGSSERGEGSQSERNRSTDSDQGMERDRSSGAGQTSAGITNRRIDDELSEQEELPERGSRQSER